MKFAFQIQVLQTPTRWRGMGRYTFHLLEAFLRLRPDHEYVLIGGSQLNPLSEDDVASLGTEPVYLPFGDSEESNRDLLARFIDETAVDVFIECAPFEAYQGASAPEICGRVSARVGTILYDIIPAILSDLYLPNRASRLAYSQKLRLLARSDFILSISQCSRIDFSHRFEVSPKICGDIGGGVSPFFYEPADKGREVAIEIAPLLANPGIFYLGGGDPRKNEMRLIEAYSLLPSALRERHPLVFAHVTDDASRKRFFDHARSFGVEDRLVHLGFVGDADLKRLYETCAVFVFPSLYEGYGLPIAEAIVCGAPVVASAVSSMPEVYGDAALPISRPEDPVEIASRIQEVLESDALRSDLKRKSLQRRDWFRWEKVAARMDRHLENWLGSEARGFRSMRSTKRKRIAIFTPLPPLRTGIADYVADLIPHLRAYFDIDLFIADGYEPDRQDPRLAGCRILDHRLFPEYDESERYDTINHQLGSSEFHLFQIEWILKYPSVVMQHDGTLEGLMGLINQKWPGRYPALQIETLLSVEKEINHSLSRNPQASNGMKLNRWLIRHSSAVLVQTLSLFDFLHENGSGIEGASIRYVPQPIPPLASRGGAGRFRSQYGIPEDGLLIGAFGIMHPVKQLMSLYRASAMARESGISLHLMFVGDETQHPEIRQQAQADANLDWVHFCGHVASLDEFYDALEATDIVSNLRYPCLEQMSAALLRAMSCGKAVLASNIPAFRQIPRDAIQWIPSVSDPTDSLFTAIQALAADLPRRIALGEAARAYVTGNHGPETTALAYAEAFRSVNPSGMMDERARLLRLYASKD